MPRRYAFQVALAAALFWAGLAGQALAEGQTTPARAAIVVDLTSGAVLLDKYADTAVPPASSTS